MCIVLTDRFVSHAALDLTGFAVFPSPGYHIELAGGGHYNAEAVRSKVSEILGQLETPGLGITLNSLYINQKQWTFQASEKKKSLISLPRQLVRGVCCLTDGARSFAIDPY